MPCPLLPILTTSALASLLLALALTSGAGALGSERTAPYSNIRWTAAGSPEVFMDSRWYELIAIDSSPVRDIIEFAKKRYGGKWQKRFNEDLVEVLSGMGKPPAGRVDLTVRSLDSGKRSTLRGVEMTKANRQSIIEHKYDALPPELCVKIVHGFLLRQWA